jgi:hypothetical protein
MAAPASTLEQKTVGATGKIVQITGVVVDIEFPVRTIAGNLQRGRDQPAEWHAVGP